MFKTKAYLLAYLFKSLQPQIWEKNNGSTKGINKAYVTPTFILADAGPVLCRGLLSFFTPSHWSFPVAPGSRVFSQKGFQSLRPRSNTSCWLDVKWQSDAIRFFIHPFTLAYSLSRCKEVIRHSKDCQIEGKRGILEWPPFILNSSAPLLLRQYSDQYNFSFATSGEIVDPNL